MTIIQSIVLGLLQGLTEFLPVSSSGHLDIVQKLLGLSAVPLLFDVFLHVGTLCAVILFFREKIWTLLKVFGRWIAHRSAPSNTVTAAVDDGLTGTEELGRKTIVAVIFATLVTGCLGIVSSKLIPALSIKFVFCGFLFTAVLLIVSSMVEKKRTARAASSGPVRGISVPQSLFIGLFQGIGTLPGVSRSGSTIAAALFSGVGRSDSGEFSFIVSIPAILGAFILELKDAGTVGVSIGFLPVIIGCCTAFASGYFALALLMKLIRRGKLEYFAFYLIPAGILGLLFIS
ncbi:MAG: undecaprenyl-diphosphate phosphatase [Treponema sp.]|jgi:undecaprenyl-diphosphatase|nr:undecaprenyl-diphosphate phosphatase [Treponema sp.]